MNQKEMIIVLSMMEDDCVSRNVRTTIENSLRADVPYYYLRVSILISFARECKTDEKLYTVRCVCVATLTSNHF